MNYELLSCGLRGHRLVGTDAASVGPEDADLVREAGPVRWYRCLRCDAWLPLSPPDAPARSEVPPRDEIELPLRGKPLRDRYVLRLIAVERLLHVIVYVVLAVAIFLFAGHHAALQRDYTNIVNAIEGGAGGPAGGHSFLDRLRHVFRVSPTHLYEAGGAVVFYAVLESVEMVGLWYAKRWAEYLTFVATVLLVPFEVYELVARFSVLKIVTLVVNLAIAAYLLAAKRLFGVRGGRRAEDAERARDVGWPAIEAATPPAGVPV